MNEGDLTDEQIRDWLAGQALMGLTAIVQFSEMEPAAIATKAFDIADAMMKERQLRDGGKD